MFGHIQREFAVSEVNTTIIEDLSEFCKRKFKKMEKNGGCGMSNDKISISIQKYRQNDESAGTTLYHGFAAGSAAVPHRMPSAGDWCSRFFLRVFLRTAR